MGSCLSRPSSPTSDARPLGAPSSASTSSPSNAAADREARAAAAERRLAASQARGTGGRGGDGQLGRKLKEQQMAGGTTSAAQDAHGAGVDEEIRRWD